MKHTAPMSVIVASSVLSVLLMQPSLAQPAPDKVEASDAIRRNGLESAPEALIGTWKADWSASRLHGTPPQVQIRIFDYTHDGMILVKVLSLDADGTEYAVNWEVKLDGSDGIEYMRQYGATPYGIVTLEKIDEKTLYLTATRYGKLVETGTFELSDDGQTLTFSYDAGGEKSVVVYRRWDLKS